MTDTPRPLTAEQANIQYAIRFLIAETDGANAGRRDDAIAALIAAVRAEDKELCRELVEAQIRRAEAAVAEHQRLNALLKHANSMQEWPSGILALVGKAIDPSGNTHPNDYAPSIKSLKAEHQRLREYDEAVAETLKPNDGYNCEYVSIPVTAWMKILAAHYKVGVPRG